MKIVTFLLLSLSLASATFSASSLQHEVADIVRIKEFSLKRTVILQGYDVVSYQAEGVAQEGSKKHAAKYKAVMYYFANAQNKAIFEAAPERYEPLYGGWCAYAMLEGGKTKANPKSFKIVDNRLLVFYDGVWGDTRKLWNEMTDKEAERIATADSEWAKHLK
ncbi:MAG: YHS domain-containing (seleno)protein [Lentimonas sp.]